MSTPIQSIKTIKPAGQLSDQEQEKSQAQLDYEEGRGYIERGEAALAAVALHNALQGFEEENNSQGMANALNQLGHACLQRKEYEKAHIHYQRAWEICEKLNDPMSLTALSKQLVEVHRGLKEYRKALEICFDILDTYQKNNDPQGTVDILDIIAEIYLDAGDRDKAADTYKTAASIHRNYKHQKIAESYLQKAAELSSGK
jgi:tetratricopeptide (TPR) repeat protein